MAFGRLPNFRINNLTTTIAISCCLAVTPAFAAEVNFNIEEKGGSVNQTLAVATGKVLIKSAGGDPGRDLFFSADGEQLYVIDHRNKSYMLIDNRVVDEVAALMESLSGAVENQQGVLSDLLGTFGINSKPAEAQAKMQDSGRDLDINGYRCRLFQAHVEQQIQSEVCISDNSWLKLAEPEYDTVRTFASFGNRLLNKAGDLLSALGMTLPPLKIASTTGVPVAMHSARDQLKVRLTGINPAVSDANSPANAYRLPEGYTRSAIPFTSG